MRRIDLGTELPADAETAWGVLTDTARWSEWGRLATAARGELQTGSTWTIVLRPEAGGRPRTMRPRLVGLGPHHLKFEQRIAGRWGIRMLHAFDLDAIADDRSVLRQSFEISGALVPLAWPVIRRGAAQFAELGDDLARRLATSP